MHIHYIGPGLLETINFLISLIIFGVILFTCLAILFGIFGVIVYTSIKIISWIKYMR